MWTYLTTPFSLSWSGFDLVELEPWQEGSEIWQRLSARFPSYLAPHSAQQTFYFDPNGLLRRHDYEVDVAATFQRPIMFPNTWMSAESWFPSSDACFLVGRITLPSDRRSRSQSISRTFGLLEGDVAVTLKPDPGAQDSWWVLLRLSLIRGHVGCCDDSLNTHSIVRSFEPVEGWGWCYVDGLVVQPAPLQNAPTCARRRGVGAGVPRVSAAGVAAP
jgi:hypothetical protein